MKKIMLVCFAFIFAMSMGGISFAGKDQGSKKGKGHEKKEYKECTHKENKAYKEEQHGQGPPPHAPAHGYRHKHSHGVELEYNSKIGAYTVIDFEDHFYQDDNFFRVMDGVWKKSDDISGPWTPSPKDILPPGLPPLPPPPPMP